MSAEKKMPFKKIVKRSFYLVALVGIIRFVSYSIEQYKEAGADEGILVCDSEDCFMTTHIHSDIVFDLCGEQPVLPRETGPLDGLHTHKEKNYLHFHDKVDLDRDAYETSGEVEWLYEQSLSIDEIIHVFELDPVEYCGTEDVNIIVKVNGEEQENGLEYNWIDGDDVELIYERNEY